MPVSAQTEMRYGIKAGKNPCGLIHLKYVPAANIGEKKNQIRQSVPAMVVILLDLFTVLQGMR
jgi:hypothetical protein